MKFIVAQLGARMHYAVPRMLHQAGMLEQFYTDICATKGIGRFIAKLPPKKLPQALKRLRARIPEGVPQDKITTFDSIGIRYAVQRMLPKYSTEHIMSHLWASKTLASKIIDKIETGANSVYSFSSEGLELLKFAKKCGMSTVLEQIIAPSNIEENLTYAETQLHPEWIEFEKILFPKILKEREIEEWGYADILLCGSDFVKESIQAVGGPHERCVVVPYGVDTKFLLPHKVPHDGPLRILSIGAVSLRKGAPYVLEAAKKLKGQAVFRMVGGVSVSEKARNELAAHVELTGLVPRAEIMKHYAWADVFLLPSICEGSATVTYEAMAAGLPVICTLNTGSVVRDGLEGFIVPIRAVDSIVEAITKLKENANLLADMSRAALARSREFTLEKYRERLIAAISQTPEKTLHE